MRTKPKGPKYRNLFARDGVIYYQRRVGKRRIRLSCATSIWDEAAAFRDLYEAEKGIGTAGYLHSLEPPTFAEVAEQFQKTSLHHYSESYRADMKRMLAGEGDTAASMVATLGPRPIDEIRKATLLDWYADAIDGAGLSGATGNNYLSALAGVFGFAEDREWIESNPVDAARKALRRRRRTQRGRADAAGHVCPIEDRDQVAAFYAASRSRWDTKLPRRIDWFSARRAHVADLLMLDAGLRPGEVAGLEWRDITEREIAVRRSVAKGLYEGPTKSGRRRQVGLSKRLRLTLLEWRAFQGNPAAQERALPRWSAGNHTNQHVKKVLKDAEISESHASKCLRDTYASQLLTAGISVAWISRELGHSEVATTLRHYAKWCDERYRRPLELGEDEVPADLIGRLAA